MKISLLLAEIALMAPNLAHAKSDSGAHEPNYILGLLIFGAIAAVMTLFERKNFKHFLKCWGILIALGVAASLISAFARRLDNAFGDHPWLVLFAIVAGIIFIPGLVKHLRRNKPGTDA